MLIRRELPERKQAKSKGVHQGDNRSLAAIQDDVPIHELLTV
jgi:hypothetical protein